MSSTRERLLVVGLALSTVPGLSAAQGAPDPLVAHIASQVGLDPVTATIQTLQNFGTRYSYTSQCAAAGDWLHATLAGYGVDVSFEEFTVGSYTLRNVIGRIEGTIDPDQVFIIGAHYDSTSQMPSAYAPGADDNASGVAAVLEAARILAGYSFAKTVEFIAFGGEEQGRKGSIHNAAQAVHDGKNIVAMINLDMIGYWPSTSDKELDIGKNPASAWLAEVVENAALTYADIPVHNWPDTGVCYDDQASYWNQGFDAIVLMDCYEAHANPGGSGESTPYYHKTTDTLATLDLVQTTEAVRAAVAALAVMTQPILAPVKLLVNKPQDTADVELSWIGGLAPFVVEACLSPDFSSEAIIELTPPQGTDAHEWVHPGAVNDGLSYYYRVVGQTQAD